MTIQLFIFLFTMGSVIASLLTEALKKANKDMSTNVIALIDSVVVGVLGTGCAYTIMGVEWSLVNIVCIILMGFCIWIGSMVGYDKVMQTISQIKG